jgi:hypothetical protein
MEMAANWDRQIAILQPHVGLKSRAMISPVALDAIEEIRRSALNDPVMRQIRKRLADDRFDTFLLDLVRIATGAFSATTESNMSDDRRGGQRIIERGFGFSGITRDDIRRKLGLLAANDQIDDPLTQLAADLRNKRARVIMRKLDANAITHARDEVRSLMRLISDGVGDIRSETGKRATALNTLQLISNGGRLRNQQHLLTWLLVGHKSQLRIGARGLLALNSLQVN